MPELRKDPITGRWVVISTERSKRPGEFLREHVVPRGARGDCPFCPGHEARTPPEILAYRDQRGEWQLRVVPNKFPALRVEGDLGRAGDGLYDKMNGVGAHEVIIESRDHCISLAELPEKRVEDLFWAVRDRMLDLKRDQRLRSILVFKNHGAAAGASLEHTHSQLIALPVIPKRVQEEIEGAHRHFQYHDRCVYCDIVRQESEDLSRVVLNTEHIQVICPYAPRFPFETWVVPRAHASHFENAESEQIANLAWAVRTTLRKMAKVLEQPAYNFIIHSAPVQENPMAHYHWHVEIFPRLAKSAGFEWGSGFHINPTAPEESAQFLRDASI